MKTLKLANHDLGDKYIQSIAILNHQNLLHLTPVVIGKDFTQYTGQFCMQHTRTVVLQCETNNTGMLIVGIWRYKLCEWPKICTSMVPRDQRLNFEELT